MTAAMLATLAVARADDYPSRPISLVVTFPAGGIADSGARTIAKSLSGQLKQTIIVENKAGAAGIVGGEYVAHGKPDGYTLLTASNGIIATLPFLQKKLSFDPAKDFAPIHGISISPLVIAVRADAPYKTVAEIVEFAKKNPEKLNYATVGPGSVHHLLAETFQKEAGIKMTHIPYKGAAPAFVDFLGGVVDIMIDYQLGLLPLAEAGKIKLVAVASEGRLKAMPDVPTFVESGYKGVVFSAFTALFAPAATPKPIIQKLAASMSEVLKDPAVIKYYDDRGSQIMDGMGSDKLNIFLDSERAKTKETLERAGIQPE
jgi:tripartite-type tricarboxylate transporter receptor subunit TctC